MNTVNGQPCKRETLFEVELVEIVPTSATSSSRFSLKFWNTLMIWTRIDCPCRGADGKSDSLANDEADICEDDDDETGDRVLEEQFNRFAMAMATQDSKLAQQIMQEMG